MNSNNLERLADQLLAGEIDAQRAQVLVDAECKSEPKPLPFNEDWVWMYDESGNPVEQCIVTWNYAVVHVAAPAVVNDPPAKVKAEDPDEVEILGVFETRCDDVPDGPMWPLPGGKRYKLGAVSKWGCAPVLGSEDARPNPKAAEMQRQWERDSFLDARAPLIAAEPADEDRGYATDPRRRKSERQLEMEYGVKRTEEKDDFVYDEFGCPAWREGHGYDFETVVENRQGSVGWLYDRLTKVVVDKQTGEKRASGLPWITPRCHCKRLNIVCKHPQPKGTQNTYKWFRETERKYEQRKVQRKAIARMLREMGQEPSDPKIIEWVKRVGYEAALIALGRRKAADHKIAVEASWTPEAQREWPGYGDC
jgi:isopentenyldiphosphate isomerase